MLNFILSAIISVGLVFALLKIWKNVTDSKKTRKVLNEELSEERQKRERWKKECKTCNDCDIGHQAFKEAFKENDELDVKTFTFFCPESAQEQKLSDSSCSYVTGEWHDLVMFFAGLAEKETNEKK